MSDFAPPASKLAESGIGVAAAPTGGMGLALTEDGKVPRGALVEAWREVGANGQPAFAADWGNYSGSFSSVAFFRDALGVVRLKGMATKAGTPAIGNVIFTLPEGYRVSASERFAVTTGATSSFGEIEIQPDGDVVWVAGNTTETDYISLVNISFRAA